MSGAAVILVINLLVAGLFCATFTLIALHNRRYVSARWFALTYATGMVYAVIEFLIPTLAAPALMSFLGHAAFLVTLALLNIGIARRYSVELPATVMAIAFAASILAGAAVQDMSRESLLRMFLYQAPYFLMQIIGMFIVLKATGRRLIDNVLAGFLLVSALHFLSKPVLAVLAGGPGASPRDYLGTTYAMISQSMGTVLVVAMALLLLVMLALDIVRDIVTRSETDVLSGLFNRRGFEQRLEEIVGNNDDYGLPVTLVICDLDHFKKVNDSWGHAIGDRLIALFATTLRDAASPHHILARIGGEEFAAILPGSNLSAGRLFAENVRVAFSALAVEGLPPGTRFTASFGIAEMSRGEMHADLAARADAALYEAKRAGRDCVKVNGVQKVINGGRAVAG